MSDIKDKVTSPKKFKMSDHPAAKIILAVVAVIFILIVVNIFSGDKEKKDTRSKTIVTSVDDSSINKRGEEMAQLKEDLNKLKQALPPENPYKPRENRLLNTESGNKNDERYKRLTANTTMFDAGNLVNDATTTAAGNKQKETPPPQGKYDSFRDNAPKTVTTEPNFIEHPLWTLAKGKHIRCILQPAVNSDVQSSVKCITETNTYSFKGDNILVPQGSVIYGRYSNELTNGDASDRIFFAWDRILTPDGTSINITGEAKDPSGTAGVLADEVDHHYLARYGKSILFSFVNASVSVGATGLANGQYNSAAQYATNLGSSFQQQAGQDLSVNDIKSTLKLYAGHQIYIEIGVDLDFYNAYH